MRVIDVDGGFGLVNTSKIAIIYIGGDHYVLQLQLAGGLPLLYPEGRGGMFLTSGDCICIPIDDVQYRQIATFCGGLGIDLELVGIQDTSIPETPDTALSEGEALAIA